VLQAAGDGTFCGWESALVFACCILPLSRQKTEQQHKSFLLKQLKTQSCAAQTRIRESHRKKLCSIYSACTELRVSQLFVPCPTPNSLLHGFQSFLLFPFLPSTRLVLVPFFFLYSVPFLPSCYIVDLGGSISLFDFLTFFSGSSSQANARPSLSLSLSLSDACHIARPVTQHISLHTAASLQTHDRRPALLSSSPPFARLSC
jgi:hypothetical protein